MLLYAGIDEAGYGPMLGPLCTAMCVLALEPRANHPLPADGSPPDVWAMLAPDVVRTPKEARASGGVAIDDSKRLKGSNALKTRHPLHHLERGLFAMARTLWGPEQPVPETDRELCARLGTPLPTAPMPESKLTTEPSAAPHEASVDVLGDVQLPLSGTLAEHRLLGARIGSACTRAGLRVLDLTCIRTEPGAFNELLVRRGSKAGASWEAVRRLIARLWASHAVRDAEQIVPRLVLDRQGARRSYADLLRASARGIERVQTIAQTDAKSVYQLEGSGRRLRVIVQSEAETEHFPVALASMAAKYTRELAMERFNRAWSGRLPELKPTAGYVQDARRWLDEVRSAGVAQEAELHALIRKA